jgi:outer membrane protein assembly factor BamB
MKKKSLNAMLSFVLLLGVLISPHSAAALPTELNKDLKLNPNIQVNPDVITKVIISGSNGAKRWVSETGGAIHTSPAIGSDGTVYVGSNDGKLYAIDIKGKKKWEFAIGSPTTVGCVCSSPAIGADGTIYVGSNDKNVLAINPDGTKKWEFETGGAVTSSPAIGADGTIFIGAKDNKLYAINPRDGTQKWAFVTGGHVDSSPKIDAEGNIYFGSTDGKLYAIKPNGMKKWEFTTNDLFNLAPSPIYSSPAVGADGTVYVQNYNGTLYAINPDGKQKWWFKVGYQGASSPEVGADGTVYIGSVESKLYAINPDGRKKWEFAMGGQVIGSSPAIGSDGTVYIGSWDNKLYAIKQDKTKGTQKWEFATGGPITSSPAIGPDGAVYIGSHDKNIYAIGGVSVSGVSLNKTELTLAAGQSMTLQATVKPENATFQDIVWSSEDNRIAIVDNSGKVTGIAPGQTTITATAEDGGYYEQCVVSISGTNNAPSPVNSPAPGNAPALGNAPAPGDALVSNISLSDIEGNWAKDKIVQAVNKGIVNGYPDGTFKPDRTVNRAEFAVLLMNALKPSGKSTALTFEDKDTIGSWAVEQIAHCVDLGIINGYPDGTFQPNKTINHAEMITMVVRAANLSIAGDKESEYLDKADIPDYAKSNVAAAERQGILGYITDNKFKPEELSTRAESVTVIMNMLKAIR